ncbi:MULTISPECIES: glycerol-3-phosphate acyltransferase [Candidatus Ichthyocystis]|uniref:glycerol-3-phosphate acyltransferase n=1 Tax=Candidatus Ichthyocystis TaxID=2929841 RepID=UPI000B80C55C|nr:glycerol-3-phosphate acyltransferase [Candidatus Ichthyocystis hellenicum]
MLCIENSLFLFLVSYLLGSFSFAIVLSKFFNLPDPRSYGSHSAGATNVFRASKYIAFFTLIGDISKAYFVMRIPHLNHVYLDFPVCPYDFSILLLGVILGHIFSVFNSFHGGKGVACLIGATFAIDSLSATIGLALMALIIVITRYSFLSTLSGLILMAVILAIRLPISPLIGSYICALVLIISRHRSNIIRFLNGNENKLRF